MEIRKKGNVLAPRSSMADETGYILLSRRVFPGYVLELAMHAQ